MSISSGMGYRSENQRHVDNLGPWRFSLEGVAILAFAVVVLALTVAAFCGF